MFSKYVYFVEQVYKLNIDSINGTKAAFELLKTLSTVQYNSRLTSQHLTKIMNKLLDDNLEQSANSPAEVLKNIQLLKLYNPGKAKAVFGKWALTMVGKPLELELMIEMMRIMRYLTVWPVNLLEWCLNCLFNTPLSI